MGIPLWDLATLRRVLLWLGLGILAVCKAFAGCGHAAAGPSCDAWQVHLGLCRDTCPAVAVPGSAVTRFAAPLALKTGYGNSGGVAFLSGRALAAFRARRQREAGDCYAAEDLVGVSPTCQQRILLSCGIWRVACRFVCLR